MTKITSIPFSRISCFVFQTDGCSYPCKVDAFDNFTFFCDGLLTFRQWVGSCCQKFGGVSNLGERWNDNSWPTQWSPISQALTPATAGTRQNQGNLLKAYAFSCLMDNSHLPRLYQFYCLKFPFLSHDIKLKFEPQDTRLFVFPFWGKIASKNLSFAFLKEGIHVT